MRSKLTIVALSLVLAAPIFAAEGDPPASAEVTAAMKPYLDGYKLAGVIAIVADKTGKVHFRFAGTTLPPKAYVASRTRVGLRRTGAGCFLRMDCCRV